MIHRLPDTASVECPNCNTTHLRVPVEQDSDGPYAEIETRLCNEDGCRAELCSMCDFFVCDSCNLAFCGEHRVEHAGEEMCPACMEALVAEGADALMEAAFV